jgi:DNA processing protein
MNSTEASIALNMVPGVGPVRLRRLLEVFETPEQVLLAREGQLRMVEGVGTEVAAAISHWQEKVDLSAELERIREFGAKIITRESPEYPRMLQEISNPPIVLYVWGELSDRDRHAIGVVGSRQTSHYGLECAKKLSYQLAFAGLTVVSGLARGFESPHSARGQARCRGGGHPRRPANAYPGAVQNVDFCQHRQPLYRGAVHPRFG